MKKLSKLKLTQLSQNELSEREMNSLQGGLNCSCGCNGPSTTNDNKDANIKGGYTSPGTDVCDSIFGSITVTW